MSTIATDPAQTMRLARLLRENAPIHAQLGDTAFAATLAQVASALELALAFAALPTPPPSPALAVLLPARAPSQRRAGIQRQNRATARSWMQLRVANWPADKSPPSMQDDVDAAKIEIPDVPQQYIEDERWPNWRRTRGRPRKCP